MFYVIIADTNTTSPASQRLLNDSIEKNRLFPDKCSFLNAKSSIGYTLYAHEALNRKTSPIYSSQSCPEYSLQFLFRFLRAIKCARLWSLTAHSSRAHR